MLVCLEVRPHCPIHCLSCPSPPLLPQHHNVLLSPPPTPTHLARCWVSWRTWRRCMSRCQHCASSQHRVAVALQLTLQQLFWTHCVLLCWCQGVQQSSWRTSPSPHRSSCRRGAVQQPCAQHWGCHCWAASRLTHCWGVQRRKDGLCWLCHSRAAAAAATWFLGPRLLRCSGLWSASSLIWLLAAAASEETPVTVACCLALR